MSCVTSSIVVPPRLPEAQHFILHAHAGEGIERAQRLIQQQDFGVIDQRARQRHPLRHAAGEMVRVGIGKRFEPDEAHELIHLVPLLLQDTARDQTRLNVPPDGQPREKIRVLENESALCARRGDGFAAHPKLASIRDFEPGDEPEQRRFSAAARSDKRDQFACSQRERYPFEGEGPALPAFGRRKALAPPPASRRADPSCSSGAATI